LPDDHEGRPAVFLALFGPLPMAFIAKSSGESVYLWLSLSHVYGVVGVSFSVKSRGIKNTWKMQLEPPSRCFLFASFREPCKNLGKQCRLSIKFCFQSIKALLYGIETVIYCFQAAIYNF